MKQGLVSWKGTLHCILVLLCLLAILPRASRANHDAKRLYDDLLLRHYNKLIRPVGNSSTGLTVRLGLRMAQIINVVRTCPISIFAAFICYCYAITDNNNCDAREERLPLFHTRSARPCPACTEWPTNWVVVYHPRRGKGAGGTAIWKIPQPLRVLRIKSNHRI